MCAPREMLVIAAETVVANAAARSAVLTFDGERVGWRRGQQERRGRGGRADPAKPSATRSSKIEHTEVQARVRLDTYRPHRRDGRGATQAGLLTSLPAMTEACANNFDVPVRGVLALSTNSNSPLRSSRTAMSAGAPTRSVPKSPKAGKTLRGVDRGPFDDLRRAACRASGTSTARSGNRRPGRYDAASVQSDEIVSGRNF